MNYNTQNFHSINRQKIFMFGAGLHSLSIIDAIEHEGKYELVGIIDSLEEIGSYINGYKILGRMDDLLDFVIKYNTHAGIIGIGANWVRKKLEDEINYRVPSFEFVNVIHPSAIFGRNIIQGKGIFIGAQSYISSSCTIGNFCFLHQKSHLGLHCKMGDFSSLSVGSLTGGQVIIGEFSAITLGVIVHDRITIGSHSIIGSGSLVIKDIPDKVVAYGHPAKIIRSRNENDPYLKSGKIEAEKINGKKKVLA